MICNVKGGRVIEWRSLSADGSCSFYGRIPPRRALLATTFPIMLFGAAVGVFRLLTDSMTDRYSKTLYLHQIIFLNIITSWLYTDSFNDQLKA